MDANPTVLDCIVLWRWLVGQNLHSLNDFDLCNINIKYIRETQLILSENYI